MGRIVIACYRPKPGKKEALAQLMREHLSILRSQNLVTDRDSIMMEAKDGTIIEVFEWRSSEALELAHTNPTITAMWAQYAEVCEYVPIGEIEESAQLFSEFTPFQ